MPTYGLNEWFWAMFDSNLTKFWSTLHVLHGHQIWLPWKRLDERFWAMFELTPTWNDITFGQFFKWIWANNVQIWLPMAQMSDSEQFSKRLQFDQICRLIGVNNDQIWLPRGKMRNVLAMFKSTQTSQNYTFGQLFIWIGTTNDQICLLCARWVILRNVRNDFSLP